MEKRDGKKPRPTGKLWSDTERDARRDARRRRDAERRFRRIKGFLAIAETRRKILKTRKTNGITAA